MTSSLVTGVVLTIPVLVARVATPSGVMAGAVMAAWMSYQGGASALIAFTCLVVFGSLSSRIGRRRKELWGVAQEGGGHRSLKHVFANAGPAAIALLVGVAVPDLRGHALVAACGALAGTLSDTVSGELGMLASSPPRLLLLGPIVRRGTDGGMTWFGLAVGLVTSAILATLILPWNDAWVAIVVAGVCGTLADSVLGATIERKGWLGNEGVNFVAGGIAAFVAAGWVR